MMTLDKETAIRKITESPFLRWRLLMYSTGKCVLSTTIWAGAGVVSLLRCCLLGSRKRLLNTF